ncbi:nuclear GTPase SLIP-GC [Rhineura floridana]|uniref:nuclear GTPase SLIP-GC n=1 Tax=Rhineura floridana TaxID=261503 RepID=UPI002AC8115D|nr:nuclear GTPase SLIP-GC [Rhineura floridana]
MVPCGTPRHTPKAAAEVLNRLCGRVSRKNTSRRASKAEGVSGGRSECAEAELGLRAREFAVRRISLRGGCWNKCEYPEMTAPCWPCGAEHQSLCHLRRIGSRPPVPDDADLIHFRKTVTLVGRNKDTVDYFLSCAPTRGGEYVSRIHARVIRTASAYELVDSSLTGVFVNDIRISGKVALHEGDTVTFGHPTATSINPGAYIRQPNSSFYYLFEQCDCNPDQMQSFGGERRNMPQKCSVLASPGASLPVNLSVGFAKSVALPWAAPALPVDPPLPASDHQHSAISSLAVPFTSAVSTLPLVKPSLPINSLNLISCLPEVTSRTLLSASPLSAPGGACRPPCRRSVRRSTSPDYVVLGEGLFATAESSPQTTLERTHFLLPQESPEPNDSITMSGSKESVADDAHDGKSATATGLPKDTMLRPTRVSQMEEGRNPDSELSVPSTEELLPGGSDHNEERMEVNVYESVEEAAKRGVPGDGERDARLQVAEDRAAVSRLETKIPAEERQGSLTEKPLPEASILERGWTGNAGNNLAVGNSVLLPAESGNSLQDLASRDSDNFSCSGKELDSDSSSRLVSPGKFDFESASTTLLSRNLSCGAQSCGCDRESNLQGSTSDCSDDMEMEPYMNASLLAADCRVTARSCGCLEPERGLVGPEAANGISHSVCFLERSFAEVGTQTECAKERKMEGITVESAKEGDPNGRSLDVLHYDNKLSTHKIRERFLQPLSHASVVGFPLDNEHSKGVFAKQVVNDPVATSGATEENLSSGDLPETHKEESSTMVVSPPVSPLVEEAIPVESLETPEQPVDLGGKLFHGFLSKGNKSPFEEKGEEGVDVVTDRKLGHAYEQSDKGPENCAADSTREVEDETSGNKGPSPETTAAGALQAELPGQPKSVSGSEMKCQEEIDTDDPSEEGEREVGRSSTWTGAGKDAVDQQETTGKGGQEGESSPVAMQESVSCASAEDASTGSLEVNLAPSSLGLAGRKAREIPSFGLSGDDPEGGGPFHSGCSCAGTQFASQTSKEGEGSNLRPENCHFLAHPGGLESKGDMNLNGKSTVQTKDCDVSARLGAEFSLDKVKVNSDQNEPHGMSATHLDCQQQSPALVGQQQSQSHGTDPEDPGNNLLVKPQGTTVGKESFYPQDSPMEGSCWEEACQPVVAIEHIAPERDKEIAHPEEDGGGLGQTPQSSQWNVEKGSLSLGTPSIDSEEPGAVQGRAAGGHPGGTQTDPAEVPESSSSDELILHISDSEVEKEERDSAQAVRISSEGNLQRGRSPVLHLDSVAENNQAHRKLAKESTVQGSCDAAIQETSAGPMKSSEMLDLGLQQQNPSHYESQCDQDDVATIVPQTHDPEMAVGEKSPPLPITAAAGEELEDQAVEGTVLVPVNLAGLPVESLCVPESDAKHGIKDKAPDSAGGLAENTGLDLVQDNWPMGDSFPGQPRVGIVDAPLEVGDTITEHPGSETPARPSPEKVVPSLKAGVKVPFLLQEGIEALQGRREGGPDSSAALSEGLDCSENHRTPLPKEEELKSCSSRKRHFSRDEVVRMTGSEDYSSCQKRLCLLNSAAVQGSTSDLRTLTMALPSSVNIEGHHNHFGRTVGKPYNQQGSQVTLHLDRAEQSNRETIAQIVREYFKNTLCSEKPATENEKAEMFARPPEAETAEDVDCELAGMLESEDGASCDEPSAPEDQANEVQFQNSPLDDQCPAAGALSSRSSSPAREQDKDLASHIAESMWETYSSEEESFQLSLCSALKSSPLSSPIEPPDAECVQAPSEKNLNFFFSDISNSSAETHTCECSPKPHGRNSPGTGSDRPTKGVSDGADKAAEANMESQFSCGSETSDEDPRTPSSPLVLPRESSPAPISDTWSEPESHVSVASGGCDTSGLQQADDSFDRDEGNEASSAEESECAVPRMNSTTGEKEEDDEDSTFLQRSCRNVPCQDMECDPAIDNPSALSSLAECSAASDARKDVEHTHVPLKRDPPYEEHNCQNDDSRIGSPSSSVVASEPASCPSMGDIKSEGSLLPGSSALSPTQASSQAEHPLLLSGSYLPLSSSEASDSAGMADSTEEDLDKDLCRNSGVVAWAGQMDSSNAFQGAQGDTESSSTLPATGLFGNQMLACSPSQLKDGVSAPGCLTDAPSVSWVLKEEKDLCDAGENQDSPSRYTAYPTAHSPVFRVMHKLCVPRASANGQPESFARPVDCQNRDQLLLHRLKDAEVTGQLDTERVCSDDEYEPCLPSLGFAGGDASVSRESPSASGTQSRTNHWPDTAGTKSDVPTDWACSEQDIAFQLQECQSVLREILGSLESLEGIDNVHVEKWREQIAGLQKATKMPQTYIAVVGNTGAGKSCLLNALLDEEAVLPTSAMRACTAVVVGISRAAGGSPYEAEVEFLSHEEWYKELKALLEDMKDKSGNLKKRCPDRKTEAGAAYSRVKAVYGRVDELGKLEDMQEVTQHLGTVKHICAETATDFRTNIEKFIDSQTDSLREMKGGEFWPIVKCVRIRVAKAEVLKTGAVLVDLPGIRDSNAARDGAAKEYLKNCNAVWVVASITRAVDDKTAKEMLSANLRRQLLMDGQYGSLAFVCTKTDSFNITDIVRDLKLRGEIQSIEDEVAELEKQEMQAKRDKNSLYEHLQQEQQQQQRRQGCDATDPSWLQRQHDLLEKAFRINDLQRQKDAKLRAISLICVQARNKFSKQQILLDFSAGLEEMTKKTVYSECEEDGDEDMGDGDSTRSDSGDTREAESLYGKLQVFTVSSTEYLKLCGKLIRDGQPQVFHDTKDTEIPALKKFAINTALKHSMVATEKVIRDLARVLSQMVNYLTSQRAEDNSHEAHLQETVRQSLQDLPSLLQEAIDNSLHDIQHYFEVLIIASLTKGTNKAKELCEDIVKSWGSPVSGYPHSTYRAVCNRHGLYTSPKYECVDFNSRLAEPIYKAISVTWSEVFSSQLTDSIQHFTKAVLDKLKCFFKHLKKELHKQSRITDAIHVIYRQQMQAARARLLNFTLDLTGYITRRQRMISRVLTPEIQARMEPAYAACTQMSGPGYFQRMKDWMEHYIQKEKGSVFDSASKKLQEQLQLLQEDIRGSFQDLAQELQKSLKMQLEPVLKPVQKNAKTIPELMNICAKVDKLCKRSCVDYILPSPTQGKDSFPKMGRELQESQDPPSFLATCMDIRIGAVSLPHIAALQVSEQDITLTLADDTAVPLPLRSISHCECCLPLACLILHVSAEATKEICSQCRVRTSSSALGHQGPLVLLDKAQDQKLFTRLVECISSSRRDAAWFQELSLQQGREKLESLGVYYTVQQSKYAAEGLLEVRPAASAPLPSPQPPEALAVTQRPLHGPEGKRRGGEAVQLQLEKRHKGQAMSSGAGGDPAERFRLRYAAVAQLWHEEYRATETAAAEPLPPPPPKGEGPAQGACHKLLPCPWPRNWCCAEPEEFEGAELGVEGGRTWWYLLYPNLSFSSCSGTAEAKLVSSAQGPVSCPLPPTSRGSALEDCKQEGCLLLGTVPQPHMAVKLDSEKFAIPGSAGALHVQAKEGIWRMCLNLNSEEQEEEDGSVKVEKMELGTHPADCTWKTH